jgi:GNAT superfamily N-acetyltransferase
MGTICQAGVPGGSSGGHDPIQAGPEERVVHIDCTFVPQEECLRKGIATRLLSSLIDDAGQPMRWFDNKPALALVTRTFPGEMPPHYGARGFFNRRGFRQIGADPDHMYYPLTDGLCLPGLLTRKRPGIFPRTKTGAKP